MAASPRLARVEAHPAVRLARALLAEGFGAGLLVVDAEGPRAHQEGGVADVPTAACRESLFTRDGFAACDAFYRGLAAQPGPEARPCHLGLAAVSAPVEVGGATVAHLVASGFTANLLPECPVPERGTVGERLVALGAQAGAAREVPLVRNDRVELLRAALWLAAEEVGRAEEARAARERDPGEEELPGLWGIVGDAPPMRAVFELLPRLAESDATTLVLGESGTGKELVARALHQRGSRAGRPFVAQNCGALSEQLLDATLFGHVKGAFSGADRASTGLFGAADKGTLFLDEVGEMSPTLQVKLLRVLAEGSYTPVGGTQPRTTNVRVIAATHRDLEEMVAQGTFRQDLYYRLHVLTVRLPPLRERVSDIPLLIRALASQIEGAPPPPVGDAALRCLERYRWPGNVRELRSEVERWSLLEEGTPAVGPEHLSEPIRRAGGYGVKLEEGLAAAEGEATLADAIAALERAIIERGLERTEGNRTQLAKELDISRTTLADRIKRYDLE